MKKHDSKDIEPKTSVWCFCLPSKTFPIAVADSSRCDLGAGIRRDRSLLDWYPYVRKVDNSRLLAAGKKCAFDPSPEFKTASVSSSSILRGAVVKRGVDQFHYKWPFSKPFFGNAPSNTNTE